MIGAKSKVLVVDDFELIRTMLRKALADLGINQVEEAGDGQEAMERLNDAATAGQPFDAIFADWNMPRASGYDLLLFVRKHPQYTKTPFLMVTAEAERDFVIQALSAGATDYIIKPVSLESLKSKIESIKKRFAKAS